MPDEKKLSLPILLEAMDRLETALTIYAGDSELVYANQSARRLWPEMIGALEAGETRYEGTRRQVQSMYPDLDEAAIDQYTQYACQSQSSGEAHEIHGENDKIMRCHHEQMADHQILGIGVDVTELFCQAKALKKAERDAQRASDAKSAFLANMSHEIRTPLNGVVGIAQCLSQTSLDEHQKELVDLIMTSGRTLERLLSDILDVTKVESGELHIQTEPFELRSVMENAVELLKTRAIDKNVELHLTISEDADAKFMGDPVRVGQVISNLVSNAIKFTDEGSVTVRADFIWDRSPETAPCLTIEVVDTGIGFPQDEAEALFTRFNQSELHKDRHSGGAGLGLSICHSLVELMGGTVAAKSEPWKGATFTVTIPLTRIDKRDEQGAAIAVTTAPDEKSDAFRILIAEDNPMNRRVMEIILNEIGADLTFTTNGEDAVREYWAGSFDLVILDQMMPQKDGISAISDIRGIEASRRTSRVPIMMVTANTVAADRKRAFNVGCDAYVLKPISPATLIAGIEEAVSAADAKTSRSDTAREVG